MVAQAEQSTLPDSESENIKITEPNDADFDTAQEMSDSFSVLIEPSLLFDYVDIFHEGLAKVRTNNQSGFVDTDGRIAVPIEYDYAFYFSEGFAAVGKGDWDNKKMGFVDLYGNVAIPLIYDDVTSFSEGLAWVQKDGKWGILEQNQN